MAAFDLPPMEEKVLRLVLDSATGRGEPAKNEIDRLVADESRPLLCGYFSAGGSKGKSRLAVEGGAVEREGAGELPRTDDRSR
jgi:hypothetical protein